MRQNVGIGPDTNAKHESAGARRRVDADSVSRHFGEYLRRPDTSVRRFALLGNSGSGKTTLARQLTGDRDISVLDLDTVAWEPDQVAVARPSDLATSDVFRFCRSHESWIVEGCYATLVDASLQFQPWLLVLDPGVDRCRRNCLDRPWEPHKYASKEEQDKGLEFLLNWVEEYYSRDGDMSLQAHKALFDRYTGPKEWLTELPRLTD